MCDGSFEMNQMWGRPTLLTHEVFVKATFSEKVVGFFKPSAQCPRQGSYEPSTYPKIAILACLYVSSDRRRINTALVALKKVSMTTASEQFHFPCIEVLKPCLRWISCSSRKGKLRFTIDMMDAVVGRHPEHDGHVQHPDRQITFDPIADRPANHTARMQVQDQFQTDPAFPTLWSKRRLDCQAMVQTC